MKKVLFMVLLLTGCTTAQIIQEGSKPETTGEAVMYAYGQAYVLKNVIATVYVGEEAEDLAISGLLFDKVSAIYMKEVINALDSVRAGTTTLEQEIERFRQAVPAFDSLPDTKNTVPVKAFFADLDNGLATAAEAIGTVKDITQCRITVSPTLSIPCESTADYLYIILLKYKKLKETGVVS